MKKINFILTLSILFLCLLSLGISRVQASDDDLTFNNTSSNVGPLTGNPVFNDSSTNSGTITGNATFNDQSINDTTGVVTGNACFATTAQNKGTVNGTITICPSSTDSEGGETVTTKTTAKSGSYLCRVGDKFNIFTGLPCSSFSSTISPTSTSSCIITTTLKLGNRGTDVKCLQTILKLNSDGIFGLKTKGAVILFQKSKGLVSDGIVGKKTREALFQVD